MKEFALSILDMTGRFLIENTVAVGDAVRPVSDGPGCGPRYLTGGLVPTMLVQGL